MVRDRDRIDMADSIKDPQTLLDESEARAFLLPAFLMQKLPKTVRRQIAKAAIRSRHQQCAQKRQKRVFQKEYIADAQ